MELLERGAGFVVAAERPRCTTVDSLQKRRGTQQHQRARLSMKIYRLRHDANNYQSLSPDDPTIWETNRLEFDCSPKAKDWISPPVHSSAPALPEGDFWTLGPGSLVVRPQATEKVRTHLELAGELLPVAYKMRNFTLLNVTECVDALDPSTTEWIIGEESGKKIMIERYGFFQSRVPESTLFKIPETCRGEILVVEGIKDPEDEFKHVVESTGMKGLFFELLWSDD
jgi:hypothetical protein